MRHTVGCDLLENYYLCTTINNSPDSYISIWEVVICLKIITFVLQSTTEYLYSSHTQRIEKNSRNQKRIVQNKESHSVEWDSLFLKQFELLPRSIRLLRLFAKA